MKCCLCKSKRLKYALKINDVPFMICQRCTLLQRDKASLKADFSSGALSLDYYPYLLMKHLPIGDVSALFSLKSAESLLQLHGYKVTDAQTTDEGKLEVQFAPLGSLDKIRLFEMAKQLNSQFTYLLWTIKKSR
jgi:hypothetical protein